MATQTITATPVGSDPKATDAAPRSSFFFWLSTLLLSFLLIGFAPTLYLRAFFDVPTMPGYLVLALIAAQLIAHSGLDRTSFE